MSDERIEHWNDIAYHWEDWGPPLRPCPNDIRIMRKMIGRWSTTRGGMNPIDVFLCGVTPEIATMDWPGPIRMTAVDRSASMVRVVWPGDVPGVRRGVVGNWLTPPVKPRSQDVVIIDGGNALYGCPDGQRPLLASWHRILRPGGLVVMRLFTRPDLSESVDEVIAHAKDGKIGNYHVFKWRIAMALQAADAADGVRLDKIHDACMSLDRTNLSLPQPGWSDAAASTIRFYDGKDGRLHFPTLDQFQQVLAEQFVSVETVVPSYELGDRCPIVAARPRGN